MDQCLYRFDEDALEPVLVRIAKNTNRAAQTCLICSVN